MVAACAVASHAPLRSQSGGWVVGVCVLARAVEYTTQRMPSQGTRMMRVYLAQRVSAMCLWSTLAPIIWSCMHTSLRCQSTPLQQQHHDHAPPLLQTHRWLER